MSERKFRALFQGTSHVPNNTKYGKTHLKEHVGLQ